MLKGAKNRGIVTNVATIFDAYMAAPHSAAAPSACSSSSEPSEGIGNQIAKLPYFEGDYWVGKIEAIIEECEKAEGVEGKAPWKPPITMARADSLISRKKAQMAGSAPPPRLPTRSSQGRKDEDNQAPTLDPVMARLREIFEPMKKSFFVASLQENDTNDGPAPFAVSASHLAPTPNTSDGASEAGSSDGSYSFITLNHSHSTSSSGSSSISSVSGSSGSDRPVTFREAATRSSSSSSSSSSTLVAVSVVGAGGVRRALRADPDRAAENDLCDSRQSFLNACQAQHLQFDQLRRAKHSTTMLCYALHNPTAPAASAATNDDETGAEAAASGTPGGTAAAAGDTAERRAARQQSIQLHMKLLLHTSSCLVNPCPSQNCRKMKSLLSHSEVCPVRANKKVCQICRRVYALLHMHARDCRDEQCAVLHCRAFRERGRQIRRQQNQVNAFFIPVNSSTSLPFS
jgi:E1A/CREB-binding protein